MPLFTKFLTQIHRDALSADPVPRQQHVLTQFRVTAFLEVSGPHHEVLRFQADGHAWLNCLPHVHSAAWHTWCLEAHTF